MPRHPSSRAFFLPVLSFATLLGACSDDGADLAIDAPSAQPDARADATTPDAADPTPDAAELPDAAATPDATPVAHPGCTLWFADLDSLRPTGATVEAASRDGVLELASAGDGQGSCSSNREPCYAVKLYKPTAFTGDFDVSIEVASVDAGAVFGGVRLYVIGGGGIFAPRVEVGLLGRAGSAHVIIDQRGTGSSSRSVFTPTAAGTLRLHRVGNTITATATGGTVVLEQQFGWFSDGEVGIALEEGDVTSRTSARVTSYTAVGSGAETDLFDCTADLLN
jgi:hypothetical protein